MKLTFIGADHEVTGSCHCLEACGRKFLIDCGMEQGKDVFENQEIPIPPSELDFVLLTHAHIDHSGMLPLLYARGFRGAVYATYATCDLCAIMLRDSAHIQMFEAEWRNRKNRRAGKEEITPLYTMEDAEGVIRKFVPVSYDEKLELAPGLMVRFTDVGHLLGSASIEIWMTEDEITKKIVFSGDIGNIHQPLLRDPQYLKEADYVVMESTYGTRSHGERPDYVHNLAQVIQETFDRGGNVVIPSFAVGRTQEMLYFIRQIKSDQLIRGHEGFKVYVDSPLAVEATSVFNRNLHTCFDEEAMALVNKGINPISFPGLCTSVTSDESKAINFDQEPKVIISASGMCDAGRIKHHLKHNLWRPECTILFVGYQAEGSPGRHILSGAPEIKLFGETISIHAHIMQLAGVSGHADKNGLIQWLAAMTPKPEKVFVVHGDDSVCSEFTECLINEYGYDACAPYSGSEYDLLQDAFVIEASPVRKPETAVSAKVSEVFRRLVSAGQRLLTVIQHNKGGANKDLAKFADQINSLCDKWDR